VHLRFRWFNVSQADYDPAEIANVSRTGHRHCERVGFTAVKLFAKWAPVRYPDLKNAPEARLALARQMILPLPQSEAGQVVFDLAKSH
jgi:hypothetical protein